MALINNKLGQIAGALSAERVGEMSGLSAEDIASRIERLVQNLKDTSAEQSPGDDSDEAADGATKAPQG